MKHKQKSIQEKNKQCLNCGTVIDSNFCPECGQKNKAYHLSMKDFFSDFLEELLDVDSRVLRSVKMLFTKPGFLSSEYVEGHRVKYLPPVRIYLVASVLFFLSLSLTSLIPGLQNNQFIKELTETGDIENALGNVLDTESGEPFGTRESGLVSVHPDSSSSSASISVGEKKFDVQQGDFLSNFSDNFAAMMFFLLPVAALQLKALYWRRKKLYIEHLIFSIHVHAFIFSILILTVILDFKLIMWMVIIASLAYLYLSMKNFYAQSYSKTAVKMFLLLFSYGLTTVLVMTLTLVFTAIGWVIGASG